jgi:beta-glucanase (GH16 family)
MVFIGCDDDDATLDEKEWELVWEDNFEGEEGTAIDQTKWTFDVGTGSNGWGNGELQYYTDRTDNVALDGDGNLAIVAKSETFSGSQYTSGRILTQGIFDQTYGRFEARIQLPWGQGIWPAFWMLGTNITEVSWPQCGEIDIMEYRGQETNIIHGSVHGPGYSAGNAVTKTYSLVDDRFDLDFHEFAIEWGEGYINYFVDDNLYQQITPADTPGEWVYNTPFFIILNVAVGGNFVGSPNQDTRFPQTMLVDWVRVYKEVQ